MLGIALALGASLCWGSGDFLGGFSTRRASLWAVIIGSQAVGLAGAALVTLGTGHGWPGFHAVWPVMLGGLASVVAISCFYKALAIGTMSIVAPISATNALIPFAVGIAAGERPAAIQLAGVVLAAVGVILVAVEPARRGETIGAAALPGEPAVEPDEAAALFRREASRCRRRRPASRGRRPRAGGPALRPSRGAQRPRDHARAAGRRLHGPRARRLRRHGALRPALGDARRPPLVGRHLRGALPRAAAARQGGALGPALHRRRRDPRHRRQRPLRAGDHARATSAWSPCSAPSTPSSPCCWPSACCASASPRTRWPGRRRRWPASPSSPPDDARRPLELRGAGGEPVDLRRTLGSHGVAELPPMAIDDDRRAASVTLATPEGPRTVRLAEATSGRRAGA